jgi:hypothetical protein
MCWYELRISVPICYNDQIYRLEAVFWMVELHGQRTCVAVSVLSHVFSDLDPPPRWKDAGMVLNVRRWNGVTAVITLISAVARLSSASRYSRGEDTEAAKSWCPMLKSGSHGLAAGQRVIGYKSLPK